MEKEFEYINAMKAKKILIEYLQANLSIAKGYNEKIMYAQFRENETDEKTYKSLYRAVNEKTTEIREAIKEIEDVEKTTTLTHMT